MRKHLCMARLFAPSVAALALAVLALTALLFLGTGCAGSPPQSGQEPPAQSGGGLSASASAPASQGADALPAFSGTMTMARPEIWANIGQIQGKSGKIPSCILAQTVVE